MVTNNNLLVLFFLSVKSICKRQIKDDSAKYKNAIYSVIFKVTYNRPFVYSQYDSIIMHFFFNPF